MILYEWILFAFVSVPGQGIQPVTAMIDSNTAMQFKSEDDCHDRAEDLYIPILRRGFPATAEIRHICVPLMTESV